MDVETTDAVNGDAPAQIQPRRFDQPQRLSAEQITALRGQLKTVLPEIAQGLALLLRAAPRFEATGFARVDVDGLAQTLTPATVALRFEVAGQPGWLLWDCAAALGAVETVLGVSTPTEITARPLSSIERAMFLRVTSGPVTRLARALGLEAGKFSFAQDSDAFGSWREGGALAEPRRLRVDLELEGPRGATSWQLYLPNPSRASKCAAPEPAPALPRSLEDIAFNVVARLGTGEVPLNELLELEVGDVIPLTCAVGEPLQIVIEDCAVMRGSLGRTHGKLGVRITGPCEIEPTA